MHKPAQCDICGQRTKLCTNVEIYGRPVGEWEWIVLCTNPRCGAYVSTKPGTDKAIGQMATQATKRARIQAHETFDALWSNKKQRSLAYAWLAEKMNLPLNRCHIAQFDYQQCQIVIQLVQQFPPNLLRKETESVQAA